MQIQYLSDFGHSQTIYQTTSVRNIIFENIGPDIACLDFDNTIPNLDITRSAGVEVPCTVRYFLASLAILDILLCGLGVYKKREFGHSGGEINSYFDFLGKINLIFTLNKSKNRDFIIKI